jgi:hypothetical protein
VHVIAPISYGASRSNPLYIAFAGMLLTALLIAVLLTAVQFALK